MDNSSTVGDRRSGPRQIVNSPVYTNLGSSAGGFLCDLCEGGLAIDVFGGLCNQVIRLGFDLPDTNDHIEAIAQISWTNELGRRTGLEFVEISERSRQQIVDWIRLRNIAEGSRADFATQSEIEETQQFETSSTRSEVERQILWSNEYLAELRAALTQAKRLREPKLSEQIICRLRILSSHALIRLSLGFVVMLSVFFMLGYVLGQHQSQARTTKGENEEPFSRGEDSGASVRMEPAASKDSLLPNPPFIPRGAILLQVAVLTRERDALALAESLRQKKFPAFVVMPGANHYYRVHVGPYRDAASAYSVGRRLKKEGFRAIVKH